MRYKESLYIVFSFDGEIYERYEERDWTERRVRG